MEIFRIAKPISALANTDRPGLSSPSVYILEKMPVDGAIVPVVQIAAGKRLFRSADVHGKLELIELHLISQVCLVYENRNARVAERILFGSVHGTLFLGRKLAEDACASRVARLALRI